MLSRIAVVLCATALAAPALSQPSGPAGGSTAEAPAPVQKRRVAILDIVGPPNLAGISFKLTHDARNLAAADPAVEVVAASELQAALGEDGLKAMAACGVKADCLLRSAARLPADRLIAGTLDRDSKNYLFALVHVDLQRKAVLASVERTVLIASRRLNTDYAAALPSLLRGELDAKGTITVETLTTDVLVTLDGVVVGATPLTIEALPGKHLIKLTKRSHLPIERYVVVEAGKSVAIKERLLLKP